MKHLKIFENFNHLYTKVDQSSWNIWDESHTHLDITNEEFNSIKEAIEDVSPNGYTVEQSIINEYLGSVCLKCGHKENHDENDFDFCQNCNQSSEGWSHKYTDWETTGEYLTIMAKSSSVNLRLYKYTDEYWTIAGNINRRSLIGPTHVYELVSYIIDTKEGLNEFILNVLGKKEF